MSEPTDLTDADLEEIAAGKQLGGDGRASSADRGWTGSGYGPERGYDGYGL